jgi:hypothetical protein
MNIKKLVLLALLGLSTAAVRPNDDQMGEIVAATGTLGGDDVQFVTARAATEYDVTYAQYQKSLQTNYNVSKMANTIVANALPGALVGAFTGISISYLAGRIFDAVINQDVVSFLAQHVGKDVPVAVIINLARVAAQIGAKQYWEKPLRNKVMDWMIAELKAKGVEFNEELTKTIARVSAWLGTVAEMQKDYCTTWIIFRQPLIIQPV